MERTWINNGRYGFDYMIRIKGDYSNTNSVSLLVLSEPSVRFQADGFVDIEWQNETEGTLYFYDINVCELYFSGQVLPKIDPFSINITIEKGCFEYLNDSTTYTSVRYKLSANPIRMCCDSNEREEDHEFVYFYDTDREIKPLLPKNQVITQRINYRNQKRSQSKRDLFDGEWLNKYIWKK